MRNRSYPLVFAFAAGCLGAPPAPASGPRPPNIVFIFADDLGYGDIGAFGQTKIRTPNIDRLAANGMKMMTHYAANAVCAASRCSLLSSLHPGHAWIRNNGMPADYAPGVHEGQTPVPAGAMVFPITMQKLGYVTGGFGKWGSGSISSTGNPLKQGFDHFYGYMCQAMAHNYYPKYLWEDGQQVFLDNPDYVGTLMPRGKAGIPTHYRFNLAPGADPGDPNSYKPFSGKQYSADLIAAKARAFIRENKDHPFFLYFATTIPHIDLQVPDDALKEYLGKFPGDTPDPGGVGGGDATPTFAPLACYAAMITRMDTEVGRIVAEIRDLGLEDNTVFVFTSDNGAPPEPVCHYFNSGGKFRGYKMTMYEGGSREACIVAWKGRIGPGTSSDRVTGGEDWFPTLLELAGLAQATPKTIDGVSFAPTLLGKSQAPRPFLYREMNDDRGEQFVREGKWKAVRQWFTHDTAPVEKGYLPKWAKSYPGAAGPPVHARSGVVELYNLEEDPSEQHDLAQDHPDIVARMTELLAVSHVKSDLFPIAGLGEKGRGPGIPPVAKVPEATFDFKALLGGPPPVQSPAQRAEVRTVLALQRVRTPDEERMFRANDRASAFAFSRVLGPTFNPFDLPNTATWFREIASRTVEIAAQAAQAWHRAPPAQLDGRVHSVLPNASGGSYPSVRAVEGVVWATVLGQIFPERQAELMEFGQELGLDSVAAGANYSSDVTAGQRLGSEIARRLLADPNFQVQIAQAKDECLD